jgi:hypothetical protein
MANAGRWKRARERRERGRLPMRQNAASADLRTTGSMSTPAEKISRPVTQDRPLVRTGESQRHPAQIEQLTGSENFFLPPKKNG